MLSHMHLTSALRGQRYLDIWKQKICPKCPQLLDYFFKIQSWIYSQRGFTSCSLFFCCTWPQVRTTLSSSFLSSFSSSSSCSACLLLVLDSSLSATNATSVSCSWLAIIWGRGPQNENSAGRKILPLFLNITFICSHLQIIMSTALWHLLLTVVHVTFEALQHPKLFS